MRAVDADGIWQTLGVLYPTATKPHPALPDYDTMVVRDTSIAETPEPAGAFGGRHMIAGNGEDAFIGQQGDDHLQGNAGDDALLGDLGHVTTILEDGSRVHVSIRQPFLEANLHQAWTLTHEVTLFHDVDASADDPHADTVTYRRRGRRDVPLGGDGTDDLHGGPGDDLMNGDGDGSTSTPDPDLSTAETHDLWGGDGRDALGGRTGAGRRVRRGTAISTTSTFTPRGHRDDTPGPAGMVRRGRSRRVPGARLPVRRVGPGRDAGLTWRRPDRVPRTGSSTGWARTTSTTSATVPTAKGPSPAHSPRR